MATVTGRKRKVNENVDNNVNNNDENAAQEDSDVDFLTSEVQNEDGDTSDDDSSVYSGMEDDEESDEDEEEEEDEDKDENEDEGEQADEEEEEEEEDSSKNKEQKSSVNNRKNINETNISNAGLPAPPEQDEYMEDSSDEEDLRNTVGNIPMNWYEDYPHLGYDLDGKPVLKPKRGDELDNFLRRMEDPDTWRTVFDPQTGQDVVLSDADVDAIKRIMSGNVPDKNFDPYAPWVDWFSSEVMDTPVTGRPEHKRSFVPSRIEAIKVGRMVHAIKMGWMKPGQKKTKEDERKYYLMWDADDKADDVRRIESHIPAPKPRLPGHAESYNPPPEYLFTEEEMKRWESLEDEPWKRRYPFLPRKYSSLRAVPGYGRFGRERFERCLDLYLCPRAKKMRLTIQPEDLVPQLPKPRDLQPFPTVCSLIFKGHKGLIRSITSDPSGQFLASGSDDQTIKVWEIQTGRCLKTFEVGGVVRCIAWCPNTALALLAAAVDQQVLLLNPGVGDRLVQAKTDEILKESPDQGDYVPPERVKAVVTWDKTTKKQWEAGFRVVVSHFKQVKQVSWHAKGDYFATVMPEGAHRSVLIHQLSKRRSQVPFTKAKGLVQCAIFHPIRPYLFVATQRHVRIYNLMKQELSKKLMTGAKWVSSLAVHPGGDNVLVGTYDRKVQWFDLDLSTKPYQGSRHHHKAVRAVAYHRRYPLFASASDDCTAIVSHGMVYNDLLQNPTIVPLKVLRGHQQEDDLGILDIYFHPTQPWLFTAGADATIRLYT